MTGLNTKGHSAISSMFNNISERYDLLNHLLSLGIDKLWRRVLVKHVVASGSKKTLDIACGTGDITIALWKKGIEVTGLDIAQKMIDIAKNKLSQMKSRGKEFPRFFLAPAENLPFKTGTFDAVTIGFGIRNFENRESALVEINKVLRPGGFLAILEFSTPVNPVWRRIYTLYFNNILPFIGRIISKDAQAYSYLPGSVKSFPASGEFCKELSSAGFINISVKALTGGVAFLYLANSKNIS